MSRHLKFLALLATLTYSPGMHAKTPVEMLSEKVETALKPVGTGASFTLRRLDGSLVVSLRGGQPRTPASIAKLLSSACVLESLTPGFSFDTKFYATGTRVGDVLKGDLVIDGSGDPHFVIENLREVIERVQSLYGLREITGKLVFTTEFLGVRDAPLSDDFSGDVGRSFTARLVNAPLNQNSFSVWVAHDPFSSTARASIHPVGLQRPSLVNQIKAADGLQRQISIDFEPKSSVIKASGMIGSRAEPRALYRAVPDAHQAFLEIFVHLWKQLGGRSKDLSIGFVPKVPVDAKLLFVHQSKPLSQIVADLNKHSLNMAAELTLLAAAAQSFGRPASADKAQQLMHQCFKSWGVTDGINLSNASGLSRQSNLTTDALTQSLVGIRRSRFAPEWLSSLPVLGVDGTVKKRLENSPGQARIKTGTLKDVRSTAGFIRDASGAEYAFALIFNEVDGFSSKLTATEDQIFQEVIKSSLTNY